MRVQVPGFRWLCLACSAFFLFVSGAVAGDCKGQRRVLRNLYGYVTDGPGNYSVNGNCEWLIEAPSSSYHVILTFMFMDTECTYDYLFIYDGDSYRSPLLASLSGRSLPPTIEATSGKMLLHLFSDANYNRLGFNASYSFSLCPMGCSGHGTCQETGHCSCFPGWSGESCTVPECGTPCTAHGSCHGDSGRCWCNPGFVGEACELSLNDNQGAGKWYNVSMHDQNFMPRMAAAGVFLTLTNAFYIFGGLDLNSALGDLVLYNFTSNTWEKKMLIPSPPPRHSHVAVEWNGTLIVFGGEVAGGSLANDMWMYSPQRDRWQELLPLNSQKLPGLASHAAVVVDNWLYVFGGRTQTDLFSSQMLRFHLQMWKWEQVIPSGGKPPAAAGHSMVFHHASRSLIVYGGHRPSTARFSMRVNTTDIFHVDLNYWTTLRSKDGSKGPQERAFHSATVIGNYMVVYGGNVHIHYHEEKCYEDEIFFYHLGCHQWVSSKELTQLIHTRDGREASPAAWGRYSHMAAVMNGNILLVAGGYSGVPRGDLLAYKVPIYVFQMLAQDYHLDYCSMYTTESTCFKDPECTWCMTSCQTFQRNRTCLNTGCLGLPRLLTDCQSCLAFSDGNMTRPQSHETFGWCVQNETCMAVSDRSLCRVGQISGTYGWWGTSTDFITSLEGCQKKNFLPGLHLITYQQPRNDSQPDNVSIVRSTTITLNPSTEMDVSLVYKGFIHPMLSSAFPPEDISIWARIQRLFVIAKLARMPNNSNSLEEVGRWTVHQEKDRRPLQRSRNERLFPSPEPGNKYTVQIEGFLNTSGSGQTSELTLTWDRTGVPGGSEISFLFLEPFQSQNCASYVSCLACLADQGCGWCPFTNTCLLRVLPINTLSSCSTGAMHLILSPSNCFLCEEYRDCEACSKDPYCEWQINSNKKGDFQCSRRGRLPSAIRSPAYCPKLCNLRTTCNECLSNSSQCAWCQSTQSCFFFAAYLAKYPYGDCRDWYDSVHSVPQCMDCSRFNTCRECLQNFECGWCGDADNPTIGRCLPGDFSSLKGFPNCSAALTEIRGLTQEEPAMWSYGMCPDVDECRLGMANCHHYATCKNTQESFECHCKRGYAGDGVTYCNRTCYNECSHGTCSGPPDYTCVCDLGWTSDLVTTNESDTECNVDCGCNFHSSCSSGPGICDSCQNWTQGDHCQFCQSGSFGNATQKGGCRQCECNGHGLASAGYCDVTTGVCHCTDSTEGEHCERCVPGYYGNPRNQGICYRECGGRVFLTNISSSALGSQKAGGSPGFGMSYCVWVLSTSDTMEPCHLETHCPKISLTLTPDVASSSMKSYVYAFDGLPEFLNSGVIQSNRSRLIGAFSGRKEPSTVEATSGLLVVYYEANTTEAAGFNATYMVHRCLQSCGSNQECKNGLCVCKDRYTGPNCEIEICPRNCMVQSGRGVCNRSLGLCICSDGFGGADCSSPLDPGNIIWETIIDTQLTVDTASRFLHRLGHTMVEGPDLTLWMFGGMSLREGILGSVYRYTIAERRWMEILAGTEDGSPGPSPRYFHAVAYNPSRNAMFLLGGQTSSGVLSDFWVLNLTALEWRQERAPLLPAVAGHTLTQRRGSSLLLIGGYSPDNGFNNKLLEYNIETETWKVGHQTGTPPTGLYGHSSVYHEATDAFYVFGGHRFHVEVVSASPELYSLYYPNLTWSLLAPSQGRKPLSHFFHAAVILRDTMVVIGGRTEVQEFSNGLQFYQISCNTWILPNQTEESVISVPMNDSIAHAVAAVGDRIYISGGFNGAALGRMLMLSVPKDPCLIFKSQDACNNSMGSCTWCGDSCMTADAAESLGCSGGILFCFPFPRSADECRRLRTCSECLARHPRVANLTQGQGGLYCKWCTNCPEGACIGSDGSCTSENDCRINQREIFVASNCSEISCEASDCPKCTASGKCMWTRQFKRTGETRRILSVQPTYDWTCFSHSLLNVSPMPVESSPPLVCPTPCHNHSTCSDCLGSKGADGGWQQCVWSISLQQCMSPTYLPLRCAGGVCGRVLSSPESCTPSCPQHQQCALCIRQPRCGWCSRKGENGKGQCLQGGLHGPKEELGLTCRSSEDEWAFMSCPPENECLNNHHDCNETQNCSDKPQGYECTCKKGYTLDNVTGLCRPVCDQGCVNGTCVEPNRCQCHFGYVGQNCSVECQCNKHSNCAGLGAQDQCLECFNNTMGLHCEKCKPLFVGSAVNGGTCKPCLEFCRGNSDICITQAEYEKAKMDAAHFQLDPSMIPNWVPEGPPEDSAICVNCQNNSVGDKCDSCLSGYFLLEGRCTKCQCNGHADTCSESDGTGCPCQNNTETGNCQNSVQSDKKDCYKYQCAKCKDSFHGNPVNGQQCYRLISVEQEYCFDPTSQNNCFHEPNIQNLPMGRTVFFGVQPKFTNVDIRITVDVTFGAVDIFISTSYETFSVDVDKVTGLHTVRILQRHSERDEAGGAMPRNATSRPTTERQRVERIRDERTTGLITYITVSNQQTVLIVRDVKDRVVITYPHELHALKSSRFYILLLGAGGRSSANASESQGLLFFRQDQAHIDLFVFFSVFFSCFFLFLSVCVLLWKVKQFLDLRREQRRHLQEMTKMASRPFAKLTVYMEPDTDLVYLPSRGRLLPRLRQDVSYHHHHFRRSEPLLSHLMGFSYTNFRVGPITLEPTDDGMAGVATVFFQLPGGMQAPNRACLGSALVTLRHNLQDYCSGGNGGGHSGSSSRKGLLSHENLTSMSS